MSNPIVDEILRRGAHNLIDADICVKAHIGVSRVAVLMLVMASHANRDGDVWLSRRTLSDETGMPARDVQNGCVALLACGVLRANGKRDRASCYRFQPSAWPVEPHRPSHWELVQRTGYPVNSPDGVSDGRPDGVSDGVSDGISRHKWNGMESKGGARAAQTALPVVYEAPQPCSKHPNGWHHAEPCGRCASLREYDEQQRALNNHQPVHHSEDSPPRGMADPEHVETLVADLHKQLRGGKKNGAASGGADERRNGTGEPIADDDPWAAEKRKLAALFGSG